MGGWRRRTDINSRANGGEREGLVVLVAVDVTDEVTDYALEWAIRNIVEPEDTLILLALLKTPLLLGKPQLQSTAPSKPNNPSSFNLLVTSLLKKWGLRKDSFKDRESEQEKQNGNEMGDEEMRRIKKACLEMMNDLCYENNVKQVDTQVKLLPWALMNSVSIKAEELHASWVILDRSLKRESEYCSRELNCNIILVDQAIPKVIQLVNLAAIEEESQSSESSQRSNSSKSSSSLGFSSDKDGAAAMSSRELVPPSTAPRLQDYINILPEDEQQDMTPDKQREESPVRLPPARQPLNDISRFGDYQIPAGISVRKERTFNILSGINESITEGRSPDSDTTMRNPHMDLAKQTTNSFRKNGIGRKMNKDGAKQELIARSRWSVDSASIFQKTQTMQPSESFNNNGEPIETQLPIPIFPRKFNRISTIRREMSIPNKQPQKPPPLCSVCKHKAPLFGKPPRKFNYVEMEKATNGFSVDNFLAEGGFGPVYKGVLEDEQVVAIKKHKKASAQGASEFCSEVEVLSCAQHKNLVMLVGYCVERDDWLLVYEFACNGSLDKHLHAKGKKEVMAWHHRQKVAIGAARGLRYLHEDCRVGCIVHRDLRPNNILLTHDFEPMVGDFGIARWQMDGQSEEETRVVGTLGYMAPEYTQTGKITEKADVYAFGILLIELICGLKAIKLIRHEKMYHLHWATSLIEKMRMNEMVDPRLNGKQIKQEVMHMIQVASLCVSPDPELRPRMSQVLRMLEDGMPRNSLSPRQSQTPSISNWGSHKPSTLSRFNKSNQSSQAQTSMSKSSNTSSHQLFQTPNPISRSTDIATHLRSQSPPPIISKPSHSESSKRSQTPPPISRYSNETRDIGSQMPMSNTRSTLTTRSPLNTKYLYSPFEESTFARKSYGVHENEELNNNNVIEPIPEMQTIATGAKEMEQLNNRRIHNQDGELTTKEYHAYLQESLYEFMCKTKGVRNT